MARGKRQKEVVKLSPEARLLERWQQQVFFIRKMYPTADKQIASIEKEYSKSKSKEFEPTEDALLRLSDLYSNLKEM